MKKKTLNILFWTIIVPIFIIMAIAGHVMGAYLIYVWDPPVTSMDETCSEIIPEISVAKYIVHVREESQAETESSYTQHETVSSFYMLKGLKANTGYCVKVESVNVNGESCGMTDPVCDQSQTGRPDKVKNLIKQ